MSNNKNIATFISKLQEEINISKSEIKHYELKSICRDSFKYYTNMQINYLSKISQLEQNDEQFEEYQIIIKKIAEMTIYFQKCYLPEEYDKIVDIETKQKVIQILLNHLSSTK